MKKLILTLSLIFFLTPLFTVSAEEAGKGGLNYNNDLLMGILWQQNSGEYAALCHQAFNAGKNYLRSLPEKGMRAVVFDLDETMLDNSKYAAWMVKTGNSWSPGAWEDWCNSEEADAVPGALDFAYFAEKNRFEIFYVSNRPSSVLKSTIKNLQALGFPEADADHVLLMGKTSDKSPRLEMIRAKGYEIVLLAGDNLDDFDSSIRKKNNAERRSFSENNIDRFGTYWIVLPNSVYGTFEAAIRGDYYSLDAEGKSEARLKMITAWEQ
ncbi:MAG: 5'-nucleotidase, lipoprotein e(P4) family [Spirochaetia bacterium]|jgi:5'-nucleotidase (lipoprotein e(P4) family)|nr:5'-nucleotidase, lipoprotein e(P4) family [Spirochaetia bacterium]